MKTLSILVVFSILSGGLVFAANGVSQRDMDKAKSLYSQGKYDSSMDAFFEILKNGNPQQRTIAEDHIAKINMQVNKSDVSLYNATTEKKDETPSDSKTTPATNGEPVGSYEIENLMSDESSSEIVTEPIPADSVKKQVPSTNVQGHVKPPTSTSRKKLFNKPSKVSVSEQSSVKPAVESSTKKVKITGKERLSEEKEVKDKRFIIENANTKMAERRQKILSALASYPHVDVQVTDGMPQFITISHIDLFLGKTNFKSDAWVKLSYVAGLLFTLRNANFTIFPQGAFSDEDTLLDMRRAMAVNTILQEEGISKSRLRVQSSIPEKDESFVRPFNTNGIVIAISYDNIYAVKRLGSFIPSQNPELTLGVYPNAINPARGNGIIIEFAIIETASQINDWVFQLMHSDSRGRLNPIKTVKGTSPVFHQVYWNARRNFTGPIHPSGKYICVLSAADIEGRRTKIRKEFTVISSGYTPQRTKVSSASAGGVKGLKYVIDFKQESINIESSGFKKINEIASVIAAGEKNKVIVKSFAYSKELQNESYALRRANVIKRILVDEYGVSSDAIEILTAVSRKKPYVLVEIR
ncbi:MAG TPA: OmpA family protein [Elusimicrobiales bacterium]|nr:OmpA family protein [Elusimicrobiales bacterium]